MQGEMHFEFLVEDISGQKALEILVPGIVDADDTFKIHAYKAIGRIPQNMRDAKDPARRILLTNLPKLLKGYGRTFEGYGPEYRAVVILVCDLDDKSRTDFLSELNSVLESCNPSPVTRFCLAIEEGEAWFLGDTNAVLGAYPRAKRDVLAAYVSDSICGTWERLADAVYTGGSMALVKKGWQAVGIEKSRWAEDICPRMNIDENRSPSFVEFRDAIRSVRLE
jgi:hypothetical protein